MIPVEIAPAITATLRQMKDLGEKSPRCHEGIIRTAISAAVEQLKERNLDGNVRPWDLPALQRRAATLGEVSSALAVSVDHDVLVAELLPGRERIALRGVENRWRLVRFFEGDDHGVRPETTRRVALQGWGPDAVLDALGVVKPVGVELQRSEEYLGQGETRYRDGYRWVDDRGRSILAEQVKNEIFDGATPYSTYVRGVIIDGDRGVLLTGGDDSALIFEG